MNIPKMRKRKLHCHVIMELKFRNSEILPGLHIIIIIIIIIIMSLIYIFKQ
jgi:hypothetical protein